MDEHIKVLLKIVDAQQKQLESSQQQISVMTKEYVKLAIGYSISENKQLTGSNDSLIFDDQAVDNVEINNDNLRLSLIYILN